MVGPVKGSFIQIFGYDNKKSIPEKCERAIVNCLRASSYVPFVLAPIVGVAGIAFCIYAGKGADAKDKAIRNSLLSRSLINLTPFSFMLIPFDIVATKMKHKSGQA